MQFWVYNHPTIISSRQKTADARPADHITATLLHNSLSLSLSLHFNGHFPGEPGLAGVYWSKGWWRWWWQLDYWSYKSCKAPVKSSPPTNQHPVFYRPDALPVAQATVSKHWRENTFHGLAYPKLTWRSSNSVWPLIAPGFLGGGLPCLSLAPWCRYCLYI